MKWEVQWRQWLDRNIPPSHAQYVAKQVSVPRGRVNSYLLNEYMDGCVERWVDAPAQGAHLNLFFCLESALLLYLLTPWISQSFYRNSVSRWLSVLRYPSPKSELRSSGTEKSYHHLFQLLTTDTLLCWTKSSYPHLVCRWPPSVAQWRIAFQVGCIHLKLSPSFSALCCFWFWEAVHKPLMPLAVGEIWWEGLFSGIPSFVCFFKGMAKREERQNSNPRRLLHKNN